MSRNEAHGTVYELRCAAAYRWYKEQERIIVEEGV